MPPSIEAYLLRLANRTIGPSTLRNQGASGVTAAARQFLAHVPLHRFATASEHDYRTELDAQTATFIECLPEGAQNWGTARKALNLFLGECHYHRLVSDRYGLMVILPFLEVPLDSQVAHFLYRQARSEKAPFVHRWPGIRSLTPAVSGKYQAFASAFASSLGPGWARIHIDLIAWQRG